MTKNAASSLAHGDYSRSDERVFPVALGAKVALEIHPREVFLLSAVRKVAGNATDDAARKGREGERHFRVFGLRAYPDRMRGTLRMTTHARLYRRGPRRQKPAVVLVSGRFLCALADADRERSGRVRGSQKIEIVTSGFEEFNLLDAGKPSQRLNLLRASLERRSG